MFTEELYEKVKEINQKNRERQERKTLREYQTEITKDTIKDTCLQLADTRRIMRESTDMCQEDIDKYINECLTEAYNEIDNMSEKDFLAKQMKEIKSLLIDLLK